MKLVTVEYKDQVMIARKFEIPETKCNQNIDYGGALKLICSYTLQNYFHVHVINVLITKVFTVVRRH